MTTPKPGSRPEGNRFARLALLAAVMVALIAGCAVSASAQGPCCEVTAVNAANRVAVARDGASGRLFQFTLQNPALFSQLRVGQKIYANFSARQVSLDGRSLAGAILNIAAPAPTPAPQPAMRGVTPPPAPLSRGQAPPGAATSAANPAPAAATRGAPSATTAQLAGLSRGAATPTPISLPQVSAGPPQLVQPNGQSPRGGIQIARSSLGNGLVHLRGIDGIKQAKGISDATKDFLLMHARTLPPDQVDNYVVNPQAAEEWFRTHPEPESVKKAANKGDGHTGCNAISVNCAEEAGKHAEDEASRQSQKLLQAAQDEWNHVSHEVAHDWNMTEDCFADHTLHLPNVPVKFSILPQFPLSFGKKWDNQQPIRLGFRQRQGHGHVWRSH